MTPRGKTGLWRWHAAAFAGYALLALVFIDHGRSLTREIQGQGADPFIFVWCLAWWPWAISHHLDPLYTGLIWQPLGVYMGWLTSVPLLALAGWPLTLISPVFTYNFFILLGPILAAFMAYLLCLHITRQPHAALIGGFLFGYSSYEMGQDVTTLNLSFTFCVPALMLLILLRLDDRLNRARLIALGALALICQFLICIEIFAMIFIFGGIAWALALVYLRERRAVLRRLVMDALLTAPWVLIALSPLLVSMARHADMVSLPAIWPYYFGTDLLNFFIPARTNLFGGGWISYISRSFNGGPQEQGGYIGLPLLVIILMFAREQATRPAARLLVVMFLLLALLSMGPRLWIAGHYTGVPLPWTLFLHLPLLWGALPIRFALFVSLTSAMIAALWIAAGKPAAGAANPDSQRRLRLALGGLACFALLPALHPWMPIPASRFFQPGRLQAVLGTNARVLVLPFAVQGPSAFWQAENHFGYRQTGGYLGFPPKPMEAYPAAKELFGAFENPGFRTDLAAFCQATHTQFIVMGAGTSAKLQSEVAQLHWPAQKIDDVTVFAVPGSDARVQDHAEIGFNRHSLF
jgi:hypothetical protein